MPPKNHSLSLLFHPKKNQNQKGPAQSQPKPRPKPPGAVEKKEEEDEDHLKLPDTPYSEYKLLSSSLKGWKYDVMKFDSRKPVDILRWTAPVKLNRKDLRREDRTAAAAKVPEAVRPMLGLDGKPVIGVDGKPVMVDAEGKPIHESGGTSSKDKGKANKRRFQKKTRQVFLVPDEVRQMQREERYPWVMEDSHPTHKEHWIGQLEDLSKAETHAFFMPAANDSFKFVPAHRWYKFQKKLNHDFPTATADVESAYTKAQKKDPQAWLATFHGGKGASASTMAIFKGEAEDQKPSGPVGPGGRKLKAVDRPPTSLLEDDEDPAVRRKRERELGEEGDLDEQLFEEDFADDEEMAAPDIDEEEAKELEERMKREYKLANKQRDAGVDEDEEDDEEEDLAKVKAKRRMEKMIRNREGNDAYESDDDENPYLSSAEEEEEEELPVPTGPAIQPQPQQVDQPNTPRPSTNKPAAPGSNSRTTSPATSPSLGGHSLVAKRATSPKVPKARVPGSQPGSRATSPNPGSRATSPLANGAQKRKAEDPGTPASQNGGPSAGGQPKLKKKKVAATASNAELEGLIIDWLRNTENPTTRGCIQHFNSYLVDAAKKKEFSEMVKRVAALKDGRLTLKPEFRSRNP